MNKVSREYVDDLTGLYNRRYLSLQIEEQLKQTKDTGIPLSIFIIDIDHFKNVNDIYGHTRGDLLLKEFAAFLKRSLREQDAAIRYGGDEFVCILPNTNYQQALKVAERLADQCRATEFAGTRMTLSVGISSAPEHASNWQMLFDIADRNLYSAKREGRDRIGMLSKEKRGLVVPTKEIVGRADELKKINECIQPLFNGAVFVTGEVGVGKTRLVHEIIKQPQYRDTQLLESDLSIMTQSIPYYPFREIIRTAIRKDDGENINKLPEAYQIELVKIVPELSDRSKKAAQDIFMLDKYRLFEGVKKVLAMYSSRGPLFLFIDNLHWADDGSLELLHYLIRTLKGNRIFFFLVYRAEESRVGVFQNTLQLMAREGLYETVDLMPFSKVDATRMLALITDSNPSFGFVEYIFNQTGGNPFFIEELIKSLESSGALPWDDKKMIFDESKKTRIPQSIESVVDRKLSMLDKETYNLLECASVIGREFDFIFLQNVTQINEGHLFDLVDRAMESRLLKETTAERFCFSEDIIREIIYSKISGIKLKRYHQAIGEKLLSFNTGNLQNVVEELSHHFYLCGDPALTVRFSMIAADKATDSYANQEALKLYTRALEYLDRSSIEDGETKKIWCLKKKAEVCNLIGENERAIKDLEEAIARAKAIGKKAEEADCLIALCKIHINRAQYSHAKRNARRALGICKRVSDKRCETSSLLSIGTVHWALADYQKAFKCYEQSLAITKETGDRRSEAGNLNNLGAIYTELGEQQKALEVYQQALKIREEINDRRGKAASLNNIGTVYSDLGDHQQALEFYQRSLNIKKAIGDRNGEASSLNNIGNIHSSRGEYQDALDFFHRAMTIINEIGNRKAEAACQINIGTVYKKLGEYEKALEFYRNSLRITEDIGEQYIQASNLTSSADLFIEMNDCPSARECYDRAYRIARTTKSKSLLIGVSAGFATLYLTTGNLKRAERYLNKTLLLIRKTGTKDIKAHVLCLFGRLYAKKSKWKMAKSSFAEAISLYEELNDKFELAKVYYHQGSMFKASCNEQGARRSFAKAGEMFKALAAKKWMHKIKESL